MSSDLLPSFLTVNEVAARLRISKMTVYRLIERDELRAFKIGRDYRISTQAFEAYLRSVQA